MKVEAEMRAQLVNIKHFYDKDTKARIVTPLLAFKVTQKEAGKIFGAEFKRAVFDGIEEREEKVPAEDGSKKLETKTSVQFAWRSPLKLNAVFQKHRLKMLGFDYVCTPEQLTVEACEDEAAVIAKIKCPLNGENPDFQGKLATSYGDMFNMKLAWVQGDLPGTTDESAPTKAGPRNFGNNAPKNV